MTFDAAQPFVLLDDASPGGGARLFTGLRDVVVATAPEEIIPALEQLASSSGHRAGFIGFDAGYALEPALAGLCPPGGDGLPLLWFGVFEYAEPFDATTLEAGRARVGVPIPAAGEQPFADRVDAILRHIAAGDLYQANLTFAATVAIGGHPVAIYRRLRAAAAAPHGALIHTGDAWVLSCSPELFFTLRDGRLTTRPMKGTAPRGPTAAADDAAAAALAADPKNRAENLMIVDLLRNDLARIANAGSVAVPALFDVERYPTLLQMTSTVTATTSVDAVAALRALFPCGSITGAPKIAAMARLAAIEGSARGLYTGSIGAIDADGSASFNVAIRTLVMTGRGSARIGLGAGIVADSVAADEWRECLAKGAFLQRGAPPAVVETMRLAGGAVAHRERHLARAAATARFLGYPCDPAALEAAVARAAAAGGDARLRLLIAASGHHAIELAPLPPPLAPVAVALVPLPVDAGDWRLRHKTTDRAFYDLARTAAGTAEVVFVLPDGAISEGSFPNVFVARNGRLLTPPAAIGLLPGVLRGHLLDTGAAREARLTADDLAGGFFVGNALRGLLPARLVGDGGRPSAPGPADHPQPGEDQRHDGGIGQ